MASGGGGGCGPAGDVADQLRSLFREGAAGGLGDGELLERFVSRRDEGAAGRAFAALVDRHGPMVRRVCRDVLDDPHDADDAAQAVFLVLARRAGSVRRRESLASWLYGVARRVAARARRDATRRRRHERRGAELSSRRREAEEAGPGDAGHVPWEELYQEMDRLPRIYRDAVVLCHLEGLSHEQAAARLDCPLRTLQSRLQRARARLRTRLTHRGVGPAAAPPVAIRATAPELWKQSTIGAAVRFAAGGTTAAAVSETAAALARGALRAMLLEKLKSTAAVAALLGLAACGAGALAQSKDQFPVDKPKRSIGNDAETRRPEELVSYPIEVKAEGVSEYPGLTIAFRDLRLETGPVAVVPIACEKGVTGAVLIGDGTFRYAPDGAKPIEGHIRAAMLRFNPTDLTKIIPSAGAKKVTDRGAAELSRHLLNDVFRRCWHRGMAALIPPERSLAAVLYSREHGELLISGDETSTVVHNFTTKKTLYEKKRP